MMTLLDDLKGIKKYDKSNMLELIRLFPEQCRRAAAIGNSFKVPDAFKISYKNIVCLGVGGSAIGSDLVRSYAAGEVRLPIHVIRNYTLPRFVNKESLVIVSSYSGNTEETLSAYSDAKMRSAKMIAITSGGELERRAIQDGFPTILIPSGLPPRCALGYSFFPLLILLSRFGFIADKSKDIDKTVKILEKLNETKIGPDVPAKRNIAKKIALNIYGKYPIIYVGQDNIDAVATRWRGQIAENSKTLSSSHIFPEMNHNEIVGWENPKKLLKDMVVLMLRDKSDHPRTTKRMDITKKIIKKAGSVVTEIESAGESLLARIFYLIYTGDFVSFYLAILNKRDPTPVESVTYLKKELTKFNKGYR